jgi:hypothetical protein
MTERELAKKEVRRLFLFAAKTLRNLEREKRLTELSMTRRGEWMAFYKCGRCGGVA